LVVYADQIENTQGILENMISKKQRMLKHTQGDGSLVSIKQAWYDLGEKGKGA
jgi:hypothetical protein